MKRGQRSEGRRQKAEDRRQKAEGGRRKAEGRRQKAEGRRRKAEGGRRKLQFFHFSFPFVICHLSLFDLVRWSPTDDVNNTMTNDK